MGAMGTKLKFPGFQPILRRNPSAAVLADMAIAVGKAGAQGTRAPMETPKVRPMRISYSVSQDMTQS